MVIEAESVPSENLINAKYAEKNITFNKIKPY